MMKRSKSSTSILIAALTLSTIFVVSITAFSQTGKAAKPIPGIGVTIRKNPPKGAARTIQTNDEGSFTISGLEAGLYDIRLECKKCEGMDIGEAGVQLTLSGTTEGEFKRTLSKRQLISGVEFPIEIAGRGGKLIHGHVSLIK